MNELIKVTQNDKNENVVSCRELHNFLEIKTSYKDWFPRMVEYGFIETVDFNPLKIEQVQLEGNRTVTRTVTDHAITIKMAKELAMIQRTDKGKQARQYFMAIEDAWNDPELVLARSLQYANQKLLNFESKIQMLEQKVEQDKPKVLFADAVNTSKTSILIGDLAKLLKQNGYNTGQKRLFEELRQRGYLIKSGSSKNMPTQKAMEMGLFEVKENTIVKPDDSVIITKTTKVTGAGQLYFINLFLKEQQKK